MVSRAYDRPKNWPKSLLRVQSCEGVDSLPCKSYCPAFRPKLPMDRPGPGLHRVEHASLLGAPKGYLSP
jgi:hypothetical protein